MFVLALICYYYCSDIYFTTWDKCSTRFGSHNGEAYCCKDQSGTPTPGGYYVNGCGITQTCDARKGWVTFGYFSDGYAMCLKSLKKIPYPTPLPTKTFAPSPQRTPVRTPQSTPLLTRTFAATLNRTFAQTPKKTLNLKITKQKASNIPVASFVTQFLYFP